MTLNTRPQFDPVRNYIFKLEIDSVQEATFTEVTIAEHANDSIDWRNGDGPLHFMKTPGLTKFGDVTLKWGWQVRSNDLYDWRQQVVDGVPIETLRRNVYISAINGLGEEEARLHVLLAWPRAYTHPAFNAKGNDIAIVQLVLAHEGIVRA